MQAGMWGRPGDDTLRKLRRWNYAIHRIRCRIEEIFGTWKRSYGLRRMRWRGLAKTTLQVHLTAFAYNLRCSLTLLTSPPHELSRSPTQSTRHRARNRAGPFRWFSA